MEGFIACLLGWQSTLIMHQDTCIRISPYLKINSHFMYIVNSALGEESQTEVNFGPLTVNVNKLYAVFLTLNVCHLKILHH